MATGQKTMPKLNLSTNLHCIHVTWTQNFVNKTCLIWSSMLEKNLFNTVTVQLDGDHIRKLYAKLIFLRNLYKVPLHLTTTNLYCIYILWKQNYLKSIVKYLEGDNIGSCIVGFILIDESANHFQALNCFVSNEQTKQQNNRFLVLLVD